MQLENSFKNQDSIRRKVYEVDNPVQAKCSTGWKDLSLFYITERYENAIAVCCRKLKAIYLNRSENNLFLSKLVDFLMFKCNNNLNAY